MGSATQRPRRVWRRSALLAAIAMVLGSLASGDDAQAGGLYFSERGVRPLARGGAFIAGADDLGAIWHNPAGIYDAGTEFLIDGSWLHFRTEHTRVSIVEQRDPNTGEVVARFKQTHPTVEGVAPVLPIPTLVGSYKIHPEWVVALGFASPYSAIVSYPEELDGNPSPQRYGLITMDGSMLGVAGLWAAYAPSDEWRIGAGFEMLVGQFVTTQMLSGCPPDRFMCAPEQPEWDVLTQLNAGPILAPSGNFGVQWLPHAQWRVGASLQLPFWVDAPADLYVRMPSTPVFERATLDGNEADVEFELPLSVRLGVQWEPIEDLRIELAGHYEAWSMHDEIALRPDGMAMRNVVGFPDPYYVPDVVLPRGFQDTFAVRLGGEYRFELFGAEWEPRLGASFESSAIPPEYMSVLTTDMDKLTVGMGVGLHLGNLRLDLVYAHIFGISVEVDPDEAKVPLQTPMNAFVDQAHTVNGGTYDARADILGVGLKYTWDVVPPLGDPPPEPEEPEAAEEG